MDSVSSRQVSKAGRFAFISCVEIKETASIYFNTQKILKNLQRKATGEFVFNFYKGRNIREYMGNC